MRYVVILAVAMFAGSVRAADEAVTASATLDGKKMEFPKNGIAGGVKATIALLESCHDKSDGAAAGMAEALKGDHVRLVFSKPVAVEILGDKLEVSELVFTQPIETGVFWLRCGGKLVRCSKYEPERERAFVSWRGEAQAAK